MDRYEIAARAAGWEWDEGGPYFHRQRPGASPLEHYEYVRMAPVGPNRAGDWRALCEAMEITVAATEADTPTADPVGAYSEMLRDDWERNGAPMAAHGDKSLLDVLKEAVEAWPQLGTEDEINGGDMVEWFGGWIEDSVRPALAEAERIAAGHPVAPSLLALVKEATEAFSEGFDDTLTNPDTVNAHDLADWFCDWRVRAKEALAGAVDEVAATITRMTAVADAKAAAVNRLDDREHATVLAALRYWQREGFGSGGHERDIATVGDTLQALSQEEIDSLCERLNREPSNG